MKYLLETLSHKGKQERIPIWLMRQAGRYLPEYRQIRSHYSNFLDFLRSPQDAAEVTLQPLRRFDLDAAIIFADILLIPAALGQPVAFKGGEGPLLDPIRDSHAVARLSLSHLKTQIAPTLEALAKVKSQLLNHITLIGFAGSPWTVLTYMIEGRGSKTFMNTLHLYYAHPDVFQELLQLVEQATILYIIEQIKAGAEVIQLFDSWAGSVPYTLFESLIIHPHQRLIQALKEQYPHVPIICFPRGIGEKLNQFVMECKPDGVSLDSMRTPLVMEGTVIQGGIDPAALVAGGDGLRQQIGQYLKFYQDNAYIVNLGHGIQPHTPLGHVEDLIQCVRTYKG